MTKTKLDFDYSVLCKYILDPLDGKFIIYYFVLKIFINFFNLVCNIKK